MITRYNIKRDAVQKIIRWYRKKQGTYFTSENLPIDPITFESVEYPVFKHVSKNTTNYYSAKVLANFIFQTGDYRSPITREEFCNEDLKRLQRLSGYNELISLREINKTNRQDEIHAQEIRDFHQNDIMQQIEMIICVARDYQKVFSIKMVQSLIYVNTLKRCLSNLRYVQEFADNHVDTMEAIILSKLLDARESTLFCEEIIIDTAYRHVVSAFASLRQPLPPPPQFTPIQDFPELNHNHSNQITTPLLPSLPLFDNTEPGPLPDVEMIESTDTSLSPPSPPPTSEEHVYTIDNFLEIVQRVRRQISRIEQTIQVEREDEHTNSDTNQHGN